MIDKVKYLSVKAGRINLACHRCRTQKIKCSFEKPGCRNCIVAHKECQYPDRDRIVTVQESEILRLQRRIEELEKIKDNNETMTTDGGHPEELNRSSSVSSSDAEVLKDNYFQNSTTTDSSLFSFLDVDGEDEIIVPSSSEGLRYYYDDYLTRAHISGVLTLPPKEVAMTLVEKVITFIGQEYYLFDKHKFLSQVRSNYDMSLRTDDPQWICYLLITLAIGEQYANDSLTIEAPGIGYYNTCMKLLKNNFEEPSLQVVQIHLLIAFYQQGLNRSNTIFTTYGTAIRLALVMGLHRKAKNLNQEEREKRRRLWWTCYIMDTIWAVKIGQPIHVDSNDINVEMVPICELNDGFKVDILKHTSKLAIVMGDVMKKIYKPTSKRTISELLSCLQLLNTYQNNLPTQLKESIVTKEDRSTANLYLRLNQIVIITTRPLVLSMFIGQKGHSSKRPEVKQAIQKCVSAATVNITILQNLRRNGLFSNFGFWDARYLFSSLLILYMMSGAHADLIEIGRSMNKDMATSGNFTAIENEKRFKELDSLFNRMQNSPVDEPITMIQSPLPRTDGSTEDGIMVSPNSLLVDDIAKIFTDIDGAFETGNSIGDLFQPLSRDMVPDIWKDITASLKSWDSVGRGF